MDDLVEFLVEFLLEIFGGIGEAFIPDNVTGKKRKALTVIFTILGLCFGILLIVGAYLSITAKNRILGIILFAIGLLYFAFLISFYCKNRKK
ncbi:MAG: hypothetical protein E7634_04550 [Ruminococcaceae bacterium]|nr:hypothetical protein [Oscillospiraceae bacterium]